jgi:hypothetical protein
VTEILEESSELHGPWLLLPCFYEIKILLRGESGRCPKMAYDKYGNDFVYLGQFVKLVTPVGHRSVSGCV